MMDRHNRIVRASINATSRALLVAALAWIALASGAERAWPVHSSATATQADNGR